MMRLLLSIFALFTTSNSVSAQLFKKNNPDEVINNLTKKYLGSSQVSFSYQQQFLNLDGFNAVFAQNREEYSIFQNKLIGFETSIMSWKENKKFKFEYTLSAGFLPMESSAISSVAKWYIGASNTQQGFTSRYILLQKKGFSIEPYAGIDFGFLTFSIKERFPKKNPDPSLLDVLEKPTSSISNTISSGYLNGNFGIALSSRIPLKTISGSAYSISRGIPVTFKVGYSANLLNSKWTTNTSTLNPQPKTNLSGIQFSMGIGFQRKINKL